MQLIDAVKQIQAAGLTAEPSTSDHPALLNEIFIRVLGKSDNRPGQKYSLTCFVVVDGSLDYLTPEAMAKAIDEGVKTYGPREANAAA